MSVYQNVIVYDDLSLDKYISTHFRVKEFQSKDGYPVILVSADLLELLEKIRNHFGQPLIINSGHRSYSHNKSVGGATHSQHLYGYAADIKVSNITPATVADYVETLIPSSGGIGRYSSFTHVDVRSSKSRWTG